jgi:hypothetical protein
MPLDAERVHSALTTTWFDYGISICNLGDYDGLGRVRSVEILDSGVYLGIPRSNIYCLDDP